jgi:hypothetical protein
MSNDAAELDKMKYKLDLERFLWEREINRVDNNVFNRNFGVIITAIVSLAAVIVSYVQLTINSNNAKDQIALEKLKNDRQSTLDKLKDDRQFYYQVATFLLEHQEDMTTEDNRK